MMTMRDTDIIFFFSILIILLSILWLDMYVLAQVAFVTGFLGVAGSFVIEWQRDQEKEE